MNQLSESLRLAAADPPPTGIDLDDIIEGAHRAGRRRRGLGAVGGTAAAVIAIAVGTALILGSGAPPGATPFGNPGSTEDPNPAAKSEPGPADTSVPTPTEPTEVAIARLTAALRASLASALGPDVALSDPNTPGGPQPSFSGEPGGYKAGVTISDDVGFTNLYVYVRPAPIPADSDPVPQKDECKAHPATMTCQREVQPDGSVIYTLQSTDHGGLTLEAEHYRIDGTAVTTSLTNVSFGPSDPEVKTMPPAVLTRDGLPLTMDQLLEIVRDPALTLFP